MFYAAIGFAVGALFERFLYREFPFSPVRFVIMSVVFSVAFGTLHWLFPPFSMDLA